LEYGDTHLSPLNYFNFSKLTKKVFVFCFVFFFVLIFILCTESIQLPPLSATAVAAGVNTTA
jgi:hypothetical protein